MAYLETKNLCKYFGGLKAVDQVNFQVKEGQLQSIIGPNGAGKRPFSTCSPGRIFRRTGRSFSREKTSPIKR